MKTENTDDFTAALEAVRGATTVFILAGAGLSSEAGIPTYWSENGLYGDETSTHGYTALQHSNATLWVQDTGAQIDYYEMKRAQLSAIDFKSSIYGTLYDAVKNKNYFCVTSNVDSGFIRAGFEDERVFEVHGSHRNCQCIMDPTHGIFPSVNDGTLSCLVCAMPTRPNVLFFFDNVFNPAIVNEQQDRFHEFLDVSENHTGGTVILELGVGSTIPRIRQIGNRLYRDHKTADYLHVNLEPQPEFLYGEACNFENKEQWLQMRAADFIQAI